MAQAAATAAERKTQLISSRGTTGRRDSTIFRLRHLLLLPNPPLSCPPLLLPHPHPLQMQLEAAQRQLQAAQQQAAQAQQVAAAARRQAELVASVSSLVALSLLGFVLVFFVGNDSKPDWVDVCCVLSPCLSHARYPTPNTT